MDTSFGFVGLCFLIYFLYSFTHRPYMCIGAAGNEISNATFVIEQACRAAKYEDACQEMVSATRLIVDGSDSLDVIQAGFEYTALEIRTGFRELEIISKPLLSDDSINRASLFCSQCSTMSMNRTMSAKEAVYNNKLRDAHAWMSATMTYLHDCNSQLRRLKVPSSNATAFNNTIKYFQDRVMVSTSNVLSMLWALDTYGDDPLTWTQVHTERQGVWEPVEKSIHTEPVFDFGDHTPDVTVCKNDPDGCFTTVQSAIDMALKDLAHDDRFIIKIKEGVYNETINVSREHSNLMLIGDGIGKTVITSSADTTAYILGDGLFATDITFENTAGSSASRSVAFETHSDFSYVENCEFLGGRATIYSHSNRQLFNSCRIVGNDDIIAGNSTAIFHLCTILVRPSQPNPMNQTHVIAAHGRVDPAQTTGFVFSGCIINGTDEYMKLYRANETLYNTYLGRPWNEYSRSVYINCKMEVIKPEGWVASNGEYAISTLYYGEFGSTNTNTNTGAAAANTTTKRVPWSSPIPEQHLSTFSIEQFLQGDEWILVEY